MKKYTMREKNNGELAVRDLSKKAQGVYYGADPLSVVELDTDDGKRYDVIGIYEANGLTFEALNAFFEDIADELGADDDDL